MMTRPEIQPPDPAVRMADIRDVTDGICKLRKKLALITHSFGQIMTWHFPRIGSVDPPPHSPRPKTV